MGCLTEYRDYEQFLSGLGIARNTSILMNSVNSLIILTSCNIIIHPILTFVENIL